MSSILEEFSFERAAAIVHRIYELCRIDWRGDLGMFNPDRVGRLIAAAMEDRALALIGMDMFNRSTWRQLQGLIEELFDELQRRLDEHIRLQANAP